MCLRVVAAIAPDLAVPAIARPRNTARQWHKQIKWEPLTEAAMSPGLREAVRRQNPLDRLLWESWQGAGFDAAAVRPRPLQPESPAGFLRHEAARPFFLLARWAKREGAPNPLFRMKLMALVHCVAVMVVGHCVGEMIVPLFLGSGVGTRVTLLLPKGIVGTFNSWWEPWKARRVTANAASAAREDGITEPNLAE